MRGRDIWNIINLIFGLFIVLPFRLIARKKFYLFVPDNIISEKDKRTTESIHIIISLFLCVASYMLVRDNKSYFQLSEECQFIIPLTLILLLMVYGLMTGFIIIWLLRKVDVKYDSYINEK